MLMSKLDEGAVRRLVLDRKWIYWIAHSRPSGTHGASAYQISTRKCRNCDALQLEVARGQRFRSQQLRSRGLFDFAQIGYIVL